MHEKCCIAEKKCIWFCPLSIKKEIQSSETPDDELISNFSGRSRYGTYVFHFHISTLIYHYKEQYPNVTIRKFEILGSTYEKKKDNLYISLHLKK